MSSEWVDESLKLYYYFNIPILEPFQYTRECRMEVFFLYLILMNNIFNAGKLMVLEILLLKNFFWTDIQKAATINFVVRRLFIR